MLQGEHSAILSTFIKLPLVFKIFVLSIIEWPLKTGFTVDLISALCLKNPNAIPDFKSSVNNKFMLKPVELGLHTSIHAMISHLRTLRL